MNLLLAVFAFLVGLVLLAQGADLFTPLFFPPRLSRLSGTLLLTLYGFYLYANFAWK